MVPTRARNPAEGAREVRTRGKPGSDFVHAAPWSTLRSAPWCAPGRATQPRCTRGAHPGQTGLRLRARHGAHQGAHPRRRCAPGANRAPTSCTPHLGAHFGALLGAHQGAQPSRGAHPGEGAREVRTRGKPGSDLRARHGAHRGEGAHPGQTGLGLRARRTLEHTSERSLVRTMVPTRPRNPAKVCAPRCTRGAHPGQTGVRLLCTPHLGAHIGALPGSHRRCAPWWAPRSAPWWAPRSTPRWAASEKKGNAGAILSPPWCAARQGVRTKVPTLAKVRARAINPNFQLRARQGGSAPNNRAWEEPMRETPPNALTKKRGGAPVTPLRSAPWANPARVPTPAKVQARVATGPGKSQCEKPHQTLRQKKRRRSNNPLRSAAGGNPAKVPTPTKVHARCAPGANRAPTTCTQHLGAHFEAPPSRVPTGVRTVVGSEPRQGMLHQGAHPRCTPWANRAPTSCRPHLGAHFGALLGAHHGAHQGAPGANRAPTSCTPHLGAHIGALPVKKTERGCHLEPFLVRQPRQVVRTKVPTLAEVRARGKPGSDFVHCMVPTKARNPAKVPTAAKVHARCAPRGAHPGQTELRLRARRTLEHTSERSLVRTRARNPAKVLTPAKPRQVVRTKAPTLAKVGHGVGPRVGNGVGTKVRAKGGHGVGAKVGTRVGCAPTLARVGSRGGGCRGWASRSQGWGPKVSAKVGARVKVSANVGSKVPGVRVSANVGFKGAKLGARLGARVGWCQGVLGGSPGGSASHGCRVGCLMGASCQVVAPEVVCGHRVADGTLHAHDAPSRCTHVGRAGCTPDALARCAHPGRAHTWRTGRTSRGRVCTSTGVGGRGGFARGSRFAKYTLRQAHNGCDHTSVSAPDPIRTPQLSALGPE
ncbi:hypothetical protein SUGI_1437110 [Cryptomeria japonica]|uniref:Uncharacterized protein n=1 Tax=Cryptomeria japonica TaxID=3369 RepID=A0AAD3NR72_CRYJA|nr:hypothetical protein SUGI_1437110 [Cryptomeria japonica]